MKFLLLTLLPAVALGQLVGGPHDTMLEATSEPVVFAVNAAVTKIQGLEGTQHSYTLVNIVHATTQVVAGVNYRMTLHMSGDYYCDVTVWSRPWLQSSDYLQITEGPTCTKRTARALGLAGGVSQPIAVPQTPSTPEETAVVQALTFATCAFNDRTNNMFAATLGDTTHATYTQQVTSGMTYRFYNIPMLTTNCRNRGCQSTDLTHCSLDSNAQPTVCSFIVQSQLWMNPPYTLTSMSC